MAGCQIWPGRQVRLSVAPKKISIQEAAAEIFAKAAPAMEELALDFIASAAPVNTIGTEVCLPTLHPPANRRQGIELAITFTEN